MTRYHVTDRPSDGMSGSIELLDPATGQRERVRWSVSDPGGITTQERARDEAEMRLERRRLERRNAPHGVRPNGAPRPTTAIGG